MSKLRASTFACALSIALLIHGWTIASSSFRPSLDSMPSMRSEPKMRIRSSCSDRKNLRAAGVALAAGAAAQLVVDAAAFVALGAEHVEAAGGERLLLEAVDLGVDLRFSRVARASPSRPASSRSMRISALPPSWMSVPRPAMLVAMVIAPGTPAWATMKASCSWKRAFSTAKWLDALALARRLVERLQRVRVVEVDEREAVLDQKLGEMLGLLDRGRADEDRLAARGGGLDLADDAFVLLVGRPVDLVVLVEARDGPVGRDLDHVELVDVHELVGLGGGRAGHAGELVVEAEIVLEGDRGQRLVLGLDLDVLLGLERLVQAFRIAPALHHAAGELVDDDHLVVADDVVLVALEQRVGAQRLVDVVDERDVVRRRRDRPPSEGRPRAAAPRSSRCRPRSARRRAASRRGRSRRCSRRGITTSMAL